MKFHLVQPLDLEQLMKKDEKLKILLHAVALFAFMANPHLSWSPTCKQSQDGHAMFLLYQDRKDLCYIDGSLVNSCNGQGKIRQMGWVHKWVLVGGCIYLVASVRLGWSWLVLKENMVGDDLDSIILYVCPFWLNRSHCI